MADQVAINMRQQAALERIERACGQLAQAASLDAPDLSAAHRIPGIAWALRLEGIAGFLESAAERLSKRKPRKDA